MLSSTRFLIQYLLEFHFCSYVLCRCQLSTSYSWDAECCHWLAWLTTGSSRRLPSACSCYRRSNPSTSCWGLICSCWRWRKGGQEAWLDAWHAHAHEQKQRHSVPQAPLWISVLLAAISTPGLMQMLQPSHWDNLALYLSPWSSHLYLRHWFCNKPRQL